MNIALAFVMASWASYLSPSTRAILSLWLYSSPILLVFFASGGIVWFASKSDRGPKFRRQRMDLIIDGILACVSLAVWGYVAPPGS